MLQPFGSRGVPGYVILSAASTSRAVMELTVILLLSLSLVPWDTGMRLLLAQFKRTSSVSRNPVRTHQPEKVDLGPPGSQANETAWKFQLRIPHYAGKALE